MADRLRESEMLNYFCGGMKLDGTEKRYKAKMKSRLKAWGRYAVLSV